MLRRVLIFAAVVAIFVIIGAIAFFSFRSNFDPNVKVVTITKDANFEPSEVKLKNSERIKIRNSDDKTHVVKTSGSDSPLVSLEPNETSKEIKFSENSETSIYLSDKTDEKMEVVSGTPKSNGDVASTTDGKNTTTTPSPAPTATENNPLPNTGAEDYIYPAIALAGIGLLLISRKLISR